MKDYPKHFQYDIALSREQINSSGGKLYVFDLLDKGAHIYFCGLKEMMPCIQNMLKRVAESRGESWEMKLATLKKKKQWHVEIY
jgi:ferredoxin--NADP+ reductase